MRVAVKSIEPADFDEIQEEKEQLEWICRELKTQLPGVRIDSTDTIGHPMRMWEWGRVLKLIKEHFGYPFERYKINVLDLGSAVSLIGPALCYLGCNVVETDSDPGWFKERNRFTTFFNVKETVPSSGLFGWFNIGFGGVREQVPAACGRAQFDVVMCISTIEHVETSLEKQAWKEMYDMLKPGGLMIVTMDCFADAKKGYRYDHVRYTNYDMNLVKERVDELKSYGMKPTGEEDYRWHGVYVDDGSFAWLSMVKPEEKENLKIETTIHVDDREKQTITSDDVGSVDDELLKGFANDLTDKTEKEILEEEPAKKVKRTPAPTTKKKVTKKK